MNKVVHCKREKFDVYIGRPGKWGNPFEIGKDGTREEVIQKYREWVIQQPVQMTELYQLKGMTLGCWCAPKACHGDVLSELVELYYPETSFERFCTEDCFVPESFKTGMRELEQGKEIDSP